MLANYRVVPRAMESRFIHLAKRVQARWRTVLLKREFDRWCEYESWPLYYVAAATIQRAWVDFRFVKRQRQHRTRGKRFYITKEDAAAAKVQQLWKAYVDRSLFKFYLQLIKFRENGDPLLMLKAINPNESDLVDRASGLHVRFRLAGKQFPPYIVYKIFTHNNVADICAFAPKDYTRSRKKPTPAQLHNKETIRNIGHSTTKKGDRTGWYVRVDNNPWRPVSDTILTEAESIAAQYDARFAPRTASNVDVISKDDKFHYSRLKRRENNELRIKRKRRQWLTELYAAEQVELMQGHIPRETIKKEATEMFAKLPDDAIESEVKGLVEWTEHLDFATYRRDWLLSATTAPSSALLPSVEQSKIKTGTASKSFTFNS